MATFTVTNTNNSGAGSLRQEILDANALSGKDIINFGGLFNDGLAHTISLTASGLSITDDLTIQGTNPNLLTISDNSATRVFDIASGVTSAINGLTITNSYKGTGGGGISNEGVLALNNSIVTGNTVHNTVTESYGETEEEGFGGGIYSTGTLTLNHSTITGNTANSGSGIYNTGRLTVNYSHITGNSNFGFAYNEGGGIYNTGSLTVNYSDITGNTAKIGSGIFTAGSNLTLKSSTITENTADADGGGIFANGNITVSHSLISRNTANADGGGIFFFQGSGNLLVSNSTISDNTAKTNGGGISDEI
ncbi:right-handed parallel beta-helix repeat-containing protein, partial [Nostoc sp.]